MRALLLLILITPLFALSNKPLNRILSSEEFWVYEDTTGQLDFRAIEKLDKSWRSDIKTIQNARSHYWIKIPITVSNEQRVIEVITPHTENIEFYDPQISANPIYKTGHLEPYSSRQYPHKNFVFNIENYAVQKFIYLKIKSSNKVGLLFKLQTHKHFSEYSNREYLLLGIYYGLLALLIVYHLVLFLIIKQRVYLFYSLTVLCAGLISSSDDGFGVIYVWNNWLQYSQAIGLYILPIAYLLGFTLYSTSFIKESYPKALKIIYATSGAYILIFFLQILIVKDKVFFSSYYFIPFLVIYLVFAYTYWKNKYKPALFFLFGFSFALFGLFVNQLRLLQIIPGNAFTVYAFNIGIVLEFLGLALSLGYRFKEEQKLKIAAKNSELQILNEKNEAQRLMVEAIDEKEKATREINAQLEVKVEERTQQLNDLIKKLKALNIDYDKENWELRRNVRAEKESKFLQEKLSLNELKTLYPNNYKCYEFLAELKWSANTDYSCPKCGYEKYSTNKSNLSRKCSKCSSVNAPTKGSIFQSQKLELNKLFYLTYLWNQPNKLDVAKLAELLQTSEVSIYGFIKKLKEKKEQKMKEKKNISSWTDLIF